MRRSKGIFKQKIVSYLTPDGHKCGKADAVTVTDNGKPVLKPGFKRIRTESKNWYGQYRDASGKLMRVPLCPDKAASLDMLAMMVTNAAKGRIGLSDPFAVHRKKPLAEHVQDYQRYLEAKANTPSHVVNTIRQVGKVLTGCKFKWIADLSANHVMEYLADRRKPRLGKDGEPLPGLSACRFNHYLRSMKSFCGWLVKDRRTDQNIMMHLPRLNVETDRRRVRRVVSETEFERLMEATRNGLPFRELSGYDRYMLYMVASMTGYRCSELASVTPESFDLAPDRPALVVAAGYSKHRRRDELPLHPALVTLLRDFLATKSPTQAVWPGSWKERAAKMLRLDLAAGRSAWLKDAQTPDETAKRLKSAFLTYVDDSGRVFDFHALRGQFITSLAKSGVPLVTAQKLARHSDPKLTANVYTHLGLVDLATAVNGLPMPRLNSVKAKATGTDG